MLHAILQQPWKRDSIDLFTFLRDGGRAHHVDQAGPDLLDSGKLEPLHTTVWGRHTTVPSQVRLSMTFYKAEKHTQITKLDTLVNVLQVNSSDLRAGEVTQRLKARLTTTHQK